ncbi:MAG: hypothetical protein HY079_01600 [Elusimicrobia bacterium]|nr:hypothetical protein [Elusimicrobiota bacterium]
MTDAPALEPKSSYWKGVGLAFAAAVFGPWLISAVLWMVAYPLQRVSFYGVVAALSNLHGLMVFGIGIAQWAWLVPIARRLRAKGRPEMAKGVVTGGWMVFLINAACWGLLGAFLGFGGRIAG